MSLLTQASLVLTPNAVKASKIYSIIPSNGNGDMTVVRETTATRVNNLGLIESVAANVPRLNYDGSCPSILVEPQRTNLLLRSEEFENASWVKQGVSVISNSTTSPDGTIDADTITSTTTGQARVEQALAVPAVNTTYAHSIYAKAASSPFVALTRFSGNSFAIFNLSSGTIVNQTSGVNATIISVGNGWYRISFIINALTTDTGSVWKIHPCISTDPFSSVVGNSIYLWGAQLEVGAYPTSYIPTITATTRNADSITRNNIYTNNLITSLGGTLFLELNNNLSLTRTIAGNGIWIGDNNTSSTTGNSLNIRHNGGTARLNINKTIAGTLTPLYTTLTNTTKIAIDWNGTTADVFVNGVKVVTGTAFTTTNMEFLNTDGVGGVPKYIKSIILFPKPLTDSECIALTTL